MQFGVCFFLCMMAIRGKTRERRSGGREREKRKKQGERRVSRSRTKTKTKKTLRLQFFWRTIFLSFFLRTKKLAHLSPLKKNASAGRESRSRHVVDVAVSSLGRRRRKRRRGAGALVGRGDAHGHLEGTASGSFPAAPVVDAHRQAHRGRCRRRAGRPRDRRRRGRDRSAARGAFWGSRNVGIRLCLSPLFFLF